MTTRTEPTPQHTPTPWKVDPCPDAAGFWTIRPDDGSEHGDTEADPIATAYSVEDADRIVADHRSHAALVEALEESTAALAYLAEYALPLAGFRLADGLLDRNNAALAAAKGKA